MAINQIALHKEPLSSGEKIFVFFVGLASAPGCLTVLFFGVGFIVEVIAGNHYHSPFHDNLVDILKTVPAVLALLGVLTHPVALLMASIGSFSRIDRRGKVLAWKIVLGGILGWAFAYGVIWVPYARQ